MKFLEVVCFEFTSRLHRMSTWFYLFFFMVLVLLLTGMLIDEAKQGTYLFVNSHAFISVVMIFASMGGMVVSAGLFTDAALQDHKTGIEPLFLTTPVSRSALLNGRFIGTLLINLLLISVVPLGLMGTLQEYLIPTELLGTFQLGHFLFPWLVFLLPNLLITSALLYFTATFTRRTFTVYGGMLILFIIPFLFDNLLVGKGWETIGKLADPFGIVYLLDLIAPWTPDEVNNKAINMEGLLLWNRIFWIVLSGLILTYAMRLTMMGDLSFKSRKQEKDEIDPNQERLLKKPVETVDIPSTLRSFDVRTCLAQTWEITRRSVFDLIGGRDFVMVILGLTAMVALAGGDSLADSYGTPVWPATKFLVVFFSEFLIDLIISVLIIYYVGELVWWERDGGLQDLADATPVKESAFFMGKFLGIVLYIIVLLLVLMGLGIIMQFVLGYPKIEIFLYLKVLFGIQLPGYLTYAVLAMAIHILVNQKYVGHLLGVITYLFVLTADTELINPLFLYGYIPGWEWSDMSGFGPYLEPVVWYRIYWGICAISLAVLAMLFQVRGRENRFRERLRKVRRRLTPVRAGIAAVSLLITMSVGLFIYYHTTTKPVPVADDTLSVRVEYEKRYGIYADSPQPQVTGVNLNVEIYPDLREAEVQGTYLLENQTASVIDSVHLFFSPLVRTGEVSFNRPFQQELTDYKRGHMIYSLDRSLQPGDSLHLDFEIRFVPDFLSNDPNFSVLKNGTYFDHRGKWIAGDRRWLPLVGYQPNRELTNTELRKKYGLEPKKDATTRRATVTYAEHSPIMFEAVIGTAIDQTAVASGSLKETWTENERQYYRYVSDGPMKNEFAILSAEYEVQRTQWKNLTAEIYHHPSHDWNIEHMMSVILHSLDYYSSEFGSYPHQQIRLVEYPSYSLPAYSYPGLISKSEAYGFLTRRTDPNYLETPAMVIAREMAHQWWGGLLEPADRPGAPMLTEVLANYSAMIVLEQLHGKEHLQGFLQQMHFEYRNRWTTTERALAEAVNDQNLIYRKGVMAMYALKEYIGKEQVNRALSHLLEQYKSGVLPAPTSSDLMKEFRAVTPDSLQYLLTNLFEENTIWDLRTLEIQAEPTAKSDQFQVTLDLEAYKVRGDSEGRHRIPLQDVIQIGVYGYPDGAQSDNEEEQLLYLKHHQIHSGKQTLTITVSGEPTRAGIDPRHLLIEQERGDNVKPAVKRHR